MNRLRLEELMAQLDAELHQHSKRQSMLDLMAPATVRPVKLPHSQNALKHQILWVKSWKFSFRLSLLLLLQAQSQLLKQDRRNCMAKL